MSKGHRQNPNDPLCLLAWHWSEAKPTDCRFLPKLLLAQITLLIWHDFLSEILDEEKKKSFVTFIDNFKNSYFSKNWSFLSTTCYPSPTKNYFHVLNSCAKIYTLLLSTIVSVNIVQPSLNLEFLCTSKNIKRSLHFKWKSAKQKPILYEK